MIRSLVGKMKVRLVGRNISSSRREKIRLLLRETRKIWKRYKRNSTGMIGLFIVIFFVVMALFAPFIATFSEPASLEWADVNPAYASPSLEFLFGTDFYGRDVFSLTMFGSRPSLIVGLLASLISMILGTAVGLISGYLGKMTDEILMRITDFFLVIPWFPLMIVFASLMGPSFTNIIIIIGITSWPWTTRIIRAEVLSVKEKPFIERARGIGAGNTRIIFKHIFPNVFPLVVANTVFLVANSIFSESFLDFFGLSDPTMVSWGTMLEQAYAKGAFSSFAWWYILAPSACIVLLVVAFFLIGEALDEVLNPKLRER